MKKGFLLFCILLLASTLRLFDLGSIPYGLTNDESSYIYSSYSVWKTGRGIDGTFLPLSFNTDSSNTPVPVYIDAPFVGLLGVSPFSGRLPYALLGIASVFLIYLIAKKLFKNDWIGIFSAFVMAVSPWHVHLTRAAFDVGVALFFYLLGIFLFINGFKKGNILWSLIPFLLGFNSSHPIKFFYIFLLPFLIILFWDDLKEKKMQKILFFIGYFVTLLSFAGILVFGGVTRQETTLLSLSDKNVVNTVNSERSTSSAPQFLRNIFNNKFLTVFRITRENFLEPFSPQFLFLYGDTNSSGLLLGTFSRGEMYIIELPLLLIGLGFLFKKNSLKTKIFIIGGLICAVIPSGFASGKTFVNRDLMMVPFLSILVGLGIFQISQYARKHSKSFTVIGVGFLGISYLFLISSYLYQYYYRYSLYGSEAWMKNVRTVTTLIGKNTKNYNNIYVAYVASDQKIFLTQYGIFARIDPTLVQKAWRQKNPVIGNVIFNYPCLIDNHGTFKGVIPSRSLYVIPGDCNMNVSPQIEIMDTVNPVQAKWKIYEI